MTGGQAALIGERVAVVEEKVDALTKQYERMDEKIDRILAGQDDGKKDRAEMRRNIEAVQTTVESMKPEIAVVRDARTIVKFAAWVSGGVAAVISTAWAAWAWVLQHITWR